MRLHRAMAASAALAVATSAAAHGQEHLPRVGDRVRYRLLAGLPLGNARVSIAPEPGGVRAAIRWGF